jgi:glycosyltransferase involved in cell wall biosynthesis
LKKVSVIQLIDTLNPGGAERMAVNISNALTTKGIANHVIVTRQSGSMITLLHYPEQVICLNKKHLFDLKAYYSLVRFVYENEPTHVHAHSTAIVWAIWIKLLFPKITLIWHDHFGLDTQQQKRNYMRLFLPFINHTIAVKQELVQWVERLSPDSSVWLISNFADIPYVDVTRNAKLILCLANFRRQKDMGNLIDAAAVLKYRKTPFKIRIVGNLSDSIYVTEMKQRIHELGLEQEITICGPSTDVANELYGAGIGVLSSRSEGMPVALLEYGLAELAVVTTAVGQCPDIVQHKYNGLLVAPADPDELADALDFLLKNPYEATEMGKRLKKQVDSLHGQESFMNSYLQLIQ